MDLTMIDENNASPEICSMSAADSHTQDTRPANQSFWAKILDNRPLLTEEGYDATFWSKRALCGRLQLFFPLFTAVLFLTDIGMDCKVAVTHFMQGNYTWGVYTLGVVIFSLILIDVLSACFYYADQRDTGKTELLSRDDLQVKSWFYAFHFIFCGRIVRVFQKIVPIFYKSISYFLAAIFLKTINCCQIVAAFKCIQIFKTVRIIRGIQSSHPRNIERYRLYISQLQDTSILGVVEAFTEEAPQVALQLYILLQKGDFDWTSSSDIFVGINIAKSLALFSFSLLNFNRYLRLGSEPSEILELFSWASLLHFTWRLFMLIARILALVLFAYSYKQLVFVIVGIHFLFSCILLLTQPDSYFQKCSAQDILLRGAFICINTFCFFPLGGKATRKWGIPYFLIIFIENSLMVLLWNFKSDFGQVFKVTMLVTEWGTFLIGLVSCLLYYGVFHPSKRGVITAYRPESVRTVARELVDGGFVQYVTSV